MADWTGIRAAIAATAAAVSGIEEGTSTDLSNVVLTPCVKITHVESAIIDDSGGGRGAGFEARLATIRGELVVAKTADIGRAMPNVETYCEDLTVAYRTGLQLGYTGVVQDSWLDSWEAGDLEYGGVTYAGASLTFKVKVRENVTRTA